MGAELPRRPLLAPEQVTLFGFDPDELDTGLFPLADFPHFAGLTLAEAASGLRRFCRSPGFAGLVLTEVDPDHDTDAALATALVEIVSGALSPPVPHQVRDR